jgi:plasmid stabilization system protein ParE
MRVLLSGISRRRLHEIHSYIAHHDAAAASRVRERIIRSIDLLAEHPSLGFPWRETRTRALMVPGLPYRIHYEVVADTVYVLTIVHTRQKPPEGF